MFVTNGWPAAEYLGGAGRSVAGLAAGAGPDRGPAREGRLGPGMASGGERCG